MSDQIKEAFSKVKEDIDFLKAQIDYLAEEIAQLKRTLQTPAQESQNPTLQHIIPTHQYVLEASKSPNKPLSTGNIGVPTNKPTNQQTNQHIGNKGVAGPETNKNNKKEQKTDEISRLKQISDILESLDALKKEVRVKFKRLTKQEMAVFAAIYELEEQGFDVDYHLLANQLTLSETSIRDYIRKIIRKGIPLEKLRYNNKKITLSIAQDLKKVVSLPTILQLREL